MATATRPRLSRDRLLRALPWAGCAGAVLVVAIGLAIKAGGGQLGTWLPPFVMRFSPHVDPHALISVAVLAGALAFAPVIASGAGAPHRLRTSSGLATATALYALALALGLGVNLAHDGVRGWWAMFATGRSGSFEGHFEYLLGLPLLDHGVGYFLHHFSALLYYATTHIKGNPPGPLIALHLLGVHTAAQLAALCIVLGALTAPLAYDLGRVTGDEQRGRIAGLLTAFSPAIVLFGVSSTDYVYATLGLAAACLLARPGTPALVAGVVMVAFATFFSWLLFAIPAFAALLALQRSGLRRAIAVVAASAAAVIAFNGALAIAYGYDPFSALNATASGYTAGASTTRPYAFWLFGSPTAWAVMLGLPIVWCALRAATRRDPVAVTLWSMIVVASVLGLTKAETERIWLPFVPLAAVAAAAVLPRARLLPVLVALALQGVAIELLFFTIW